MVRAFARELALAKDGRPDRLIASQRLVDAALALTDLAARRLPRTAPLPDLTGDVPAPPLAPEVVRRLLADPDAWLAIERPTLVAGITLMCRVGWHRPAMLIFDRLARHLWLHGQLADLRTCAQSLAGAARAAGDEWAEARAEAVLALLLHARGRYPDAETCFRDCIDRLTRLDDRPALAWALHNLANCLIGLGQPDEAMRVASRSERLFTDDEFGVVSALRTRSAVLHRLGRPRRAVIVDAKALVIARRSGEPRHVALALHSLSWSLVINGELDEAAGLADEAVALLRSTTARSSLAQALRTLGAIHAGRGRRAEAVAAFEESRTIARQLNEYPRELSCTRAIAASWIGEGRVAAAIRELTGCLLAVNELGSAPAAKMITLRLLAIAYDAIGDTEAAREARERADRLDDPRDVSAHTVLRLLSTLTRPD